MNDQQPKESKTAEELKDERLLIKRIWSRAYLDTEESHIELIKGLRRSTSEIRTKQSD